METTFVFDGTSRQDLFGLTFPEFAPVGAKVTLDIFNMPTNINPLNYIAGKDNFHVGDYEGKESACCVFKLMGDDQDTNLKALGAWTHLLALDGEKFHTSVRAMTNSETGKIRTLFYRIYRNEDFHCDEHPEMLLGAPCGMYHCPACGEMQMAGLPHLPKEPEWVPPAGMERGVIEASSFQADPKFAELCADAQAWDDADGRKMGDPDSFTDADKKHAEWKEHSKEMFDKHDEYEPDA